MSDSPENKANKFGIEVYSKQPTTPFEPLRRELGHAYDSGEFKDLTQDRQQIIFDWVSEVKQPFDMIQRAEGQATPEHVYFGAGRRALAHNKGAEIEQAVLRGKAGRAALRRHYRFSHEHYDIALERSKRGSLVLYALRKNLRATDAVIVDEILQELGNGISANLDDKFPGGDNYARVAGNSILRTKDGLLRGSLELEEYITLFSAGMNYIKKQATLWQRQITASEEFAESRNFKLTRKEPAGE
jgi:hypothetical protein